MAEQAFPACPTPAKNPHASRRAALTYANRATKHLKDGQLHPYRCVCGAWHLTGMSRRAYKQALALAKRKAAV